MIIHYIVPLLALSTSAAPDSCLTTVKFHDSLLDRMLDQYKFIELWFVIQPTSTTVMRKCNRQMMSVKQKQ